MYQRQNRTKNCRMVFKIIACALIAMGIIGLGAYLAGNDSPDSRLQTVTEEVIVLQIDQPDDVVPAGEVSGQQEAAAGTVAESTTKIAVEAAPNATSVAEPTSTQSPPVESSPAETVTTVNTSAPSPVETHNAAQPVGIAQNTPDASPTQPQQPMDADAEHYAGVRIVDGLVEFKFATGRTYLADGGRVALGSTAMSGVRGKYLVISTYSDPEQDQVTNHALAQERALKIKKLLIIMGVPEKQIIMLKPQLAVQGNTDGILPDRAVVKIENKADYPPEMVFVEKPEAAAK